MKKYNLTILFILILVTISVSSYFYYLDVIYRDKLVKKDVEALYQLKRAAGKSIVTYATAEEVVTKTAEYNEILRELNLEATAENKENTVLIQGTIHNGYSYILLKKLLNIIKSDEVNLINTCIGKECTGDNYGFLISIKPYSLKLQ